MDTSSRPASVAVLRPVLLVALVVIATMLALLWVRPEYINPDTAQHVSVARSLLEGAGFSTNILYYEEQYVFGTLPAPQTLWPPGYPVLMAAAMALGMPDVRAAFALSIAGHFVVALLIFVIASQIRLARRWCVLLAAAWLLLLVPATLPLMAFTEPVFTAFTLASLAAFIRAVDLPEARSAFGWFLLGGVAAAAAFAVRYTGVVLIAALGLILLVRCGTSPSRRRVSELLWFGLLPLILCAGILIRNHLLTGSMTGGPAVASDAGVLPTVKALYWAALSALGVFKLGWEYKIAELVIATAMAITVVLAISRVMSRHEAQHARASLLLIWISGLYMGGTAALLVLMALDRSPELIQWRYVVPLVPFALLAVGAALQSPWLRERGPHVRAAVTSCFLVTGVLVLMAQRHVAHEWDTYYVKASLAREVALILEERMQGATLQEVLDREGSARSPVLTQDGQVLGALLRQPVLGTPSPYYTSRIWSEEEVATLIQTYQVGWVLVLPNFFDATGANDSNKVFFSELIRGQTPPWLRLVHHTPRIRLYAVDHSRLASPEMPAAQGARGSVGSAYSETLVRTLDDCSHCLRSAATIAGNPSAVPR